jgi:hypothetical protein
VTESVVPIDGFAGVCERTDSTGNNSAVATKLMNKSRRVIMAGSRLANGVEKKS